MKCTQVADRAFSLPKITPGDYVISDVRRPRDSTMRFSLRLLILVVALMAACAALWRYRMELNTANKIIDWNSQYSPGRTMIQETFPGSVSYLWAGPDGAVGRAYLSGPSGYASLKKLSVLDNHVKSLAVRSQKAIDLFRPADFPELSSLTFIATTVNDFENLSLADLSSLSNLENLTIVAHDADVSHVLYTLPKMQPLVLVVKTGWTRDLGNYPRLAGLSKIEIHVRNEDETRMVFDSLQHRVDCKIDVVVP